MQQSDPLGLAFFALAIHPAILKAKRYTERARPGGLDFHAFYLDDGPVSGSAPAVRCTFDSLSRSLANVGLVISHEKTEIIPACAGCQSFSAADFQAADGNGSANFKLLGAAIRPSKR